jgi:hypothetical protein
MGKVIFNLMNSNSENYMSEIGVPCNCKLFVNIVITFIFQTKSSKPLISNLSVGIHIHIFKIQCVRMILN